MVFLGKHPKYGLKQKIEHDHRILDIGIIPGSKFLLQQRVLIFRNKFFPPKKILPVQNRKGISLGIKYQLKLTILIFWTKLSEKGYNIRLKTEKSESHH